MAQDNHQPNHFASNTSPDVSSTPSELHETHNTEIQSRISAGGSDRYVPRSMAKPRGRGFVGLFFGLLLAAGLLFGAGYLVYANVLSAEAPEAGESVATREINLAIEDLTLSDEVVLPIDNMVQSTITANSEASIVELIDKIPQANEALNAAEEHVATAGSQKNLTDSERVAIEQIRASIDARRKMLTSAEKLLRVDIDVSKALPYIDGITSKLLLSDENIRKSNDAANEFANARNEVIRVAGESGEVPSDIVVDTTKIDEAVRLDNEALTALYEVQGNMDSLKALFTEIDLSGLSGYLEQRTIAVQYLMEADTAMLNGDYTLAAQKIDEYNAADANVIEAAKLLPTNYEELLINAYTNRTQVDRTNYEQARQKASVADEAIRNYQGLRTNIISDTLDDSEVGGFSSSAETTTSE